MCSCVYWFSGTGNSLWVAKQVAQSLCADLKPLAPLADNQFDIATAKRIGLVFPVYNHLIPFAVERFILSLSSLQNIYIYAIATYGDSPGISLEYLQKLLARKGGYLAGGFAIQMPYNYISPGKSLRSICLPFTLRQISTAAQNLMFDKARAKLSAITAYIKQNNLGTVETAFERTEHFIDTLHLRNTLQKYFWLRKAGFRGKSNLPSVQCVQLMDIGFHTTEACSGCQTCAAVCPVQNIQFSNGKPFWKHHCEQCFACLQWCPQKALQFRSGTIGNQRYHHPAIELQDMIFPTGKLKELMK